MSGFNYDTDVWIGSYICTVTTRKNGREFLTDVRIRYATVDKALGQIAFEPNLCDAVQALIRHQKVVKHLEENIDRVTTVQEQLVEVFSDYVEEVNDGDGD